MEAVISTGQVQRISQRYQTRRAHNDVTKQLQPLLFAQAVTTTQRVQRSPAIFSTCALVSTVSGAFNRNSTAVASGSTSWLWESVMTVNLGCGWLMGCLKWICSKHKLGKQNDI